MVLHRRKRVGVGRTVVARNSNTVAKTLAVQRGSAFDMFLILAEEGVVVGSVRFGLVIGVGQSASELFR
jgi:hypothetical protein